MKICDLTQAYTSHSGGIRTFIHEKRKYIRDNTRHSHILIVPGDEDKVVTEGPFKTYYVKSPLIPGCAPYRFVLRLDKAVEILKNEKPDLIELDSAYFLPFSAFTFRKLYPCIISGFYHTDFPTAYVLPFVQKYAGKRTAISAKEMSSHYARFVYNQCDVTLTASAQLKSKLTGMGIKNVEQTPLGVDVDLFNPSKRADNIRQQLGLAPKDLLFVYSGRLDTEKRVDVILDAFLQSSHRFNGTLLLIGEGPLKEMVKLQAEKNPRIKYMPYIYDRGILAQLLASSDIYITAGPHETFGLSIIEAQACGLPVLGVKAGALIERVPANAGVLTEPDSVDAMAKSIYELATNGYLEKGRNARLLVEAGFSWTSSFRKIFGIYETYNNKN